MSFEDSPTKKVILLDKIQLRFLIPTDIDELKILCKEWFPIEYPEAWYQDVTFNQKYFALAATLKNEIIGTIIAEVKDRSRCNKEDSNILGYWYPSNIKVAYILILGVRKQYRRSGIASLLLDNFLSQLTIEENKHCKAVYLHVLATNSSAVTFYEKKHFQFHQMLLQYYNINKVKMDGFCYVLYINGGKPPWSFLQFQNSSFLRVSWHFLKYFSKCWNAASVEYFSICDCAKSLSGWVYNKKCLCCPVKWISNLFAMPCALIKITSKGVRNM